MSRFNGLTEAQYRQELLDYGLPAHLVERLAAAEKLGGMEQSREQFDFQIQTYREAAQYFKNIGRH